MRRVLSFNEMSSSVSYAQEHYKLKERHMIEQAGTLAYEAFANYYKPFAQDAAADVRAVAGAKAVADAKAPRMLVLVGPGHNGSDALIFARRAYCQGMKLGILLLKNDIIEESQDILESLQYFADAAEQSSLGASQTPRLMIWSWQDLRPDEEGDQLLMAHIPQELEAGWDYIIDGILGTAARDEISASLASLISWANRLEAKKVALDIVSGGQHGILSDLTISLGPVKDYTLRPAHRIAHGHILSVDLDIPQGDYSSETTRLECQWGDFSLPEVPRNAHKYTRGHVAVFAGSTTYSGAPQLSASVISRSPAGLVSLFVDRPLIPLMAKAHVAEIVRQVGDFEPTVMHDAVVVGPGWGSEEEMLEDRMETLQSILLSQPRGVIDADALPVLRKLFEKSMLDVADIANNWILTPHIGEFSRFIDVPKEEILADPESYVREVASSYRCVVVLKSHVIWIAAPNGTIHIIDGLEPSLATGGSGDVLAGVIAVALAKQMSPLDAASYGVLLHQKRGKELAELQGWYNSADLASFMFS